MSSHKSTAAGGRTRKRDRVDAGQSSSKRQRPMASEHCRHLCFIAMMWSPEMLAYYGLPDEEEHNFISKLYQCAKKCPRHERPSSKSGHLAGSNRRCAEGHPAIPCGQLDLIQYNWLYVSVNKQCNLYTIHVSLQDQPFAQVKIKDSIRGLGSGK